MGIPDHLTCLLRSLYAGHEARVRMRHGKTDWFKIGKGIHQGCVLSPCLFNFNAEYVMRNVGLNESPSWNQDCWETEDLGKKKFWEKYQQHQIFR